MKIVKITFSTFLLILGALILIAIVNTFRADTLQIYPESPLPGFNVDSSVYKRLSKAVTYKTITPVNPASADTSAFLAFKDFLAAEYPLVNQELFKEDVGLSLMYKWEGSNPEKRPFLLMAHMDVVPADSSEWKERPFAGVIKNGTIYGRGILDDKGSMLGILEAVETLLEAGFKPERTMYIAFGHDEESGIGQGAMAISTLLKNMGVTLSYVLDEGGIILDDALPGLEHPVALIGIAEKGYLNVKVTAKGEGGHSSMPEKETAVTRLSDAINVISKNPFPADLDKVTGKLFEFAGPEMSFPLKTVFVNKWLFSPVIKSVMSGAPSSNAAIRNTTAFTVLEGSSKENVIPAKASAVINVRSLPGWTEKAIVNYLDDLVEDTAVHFSIMNSSPPSEVSDPYSQEFKTIQKAVKSVYPEVTVAPFQLVAITDSRHYAPISQNIYRFFPAYYESKEELKMLHGSDEQISFENYDKVIEFYRNLILLSNR